MSKGNILFKLTGSIACFKACQLISSLVQEGYQVQTVASDSALRFIGTATLEALTGKPVFTDAFQSGHILDHINHSKWADLAILCPATANSIQKLVNGSASDCIGSLFLSWDRQKPYLVAPAMNHHMLSHPATEQALVQLVNWGVNVLPTEYGIQACGDVGLGRLLDINKIFETIESQFQNIRSSNEIKNNAPLNILVTYGPTQEPIDGVRFISNHSTGQTGSKLVEYFSLQGHHTTCLISKNAIQPKYAHKVVPFTTYQDLQDKLNETLGNKSFDGVIHLAAVSDYSVSSINNGNQQFKPSTSLKLASKFDSMSLNLKRNPKLILDIKSLSQNDATKVIAFKLTQEQKEDHLKEQIFQLSLRSEVDYVVHNDMYDIKNKKHVFTIYEGEKNLFDKLSYQSLAKKLEYLVKSPTTKDRQASK